MTNHPYLRAKCQKYDVKVEFVRCARDETQWLLRLEAAAPAMRGEGAQDCR
jgi:hypothetical protein